MRVCRLSYYNVPEVLEHRVTKRFIPETMGHSMTKQTSAQRDQVHQAEVRPSPHRRADTTGGHRRVSLIRAIGIILLCMTLLSPEFSTAFAKSKKKKKDEERPLVLYPSPPAQPRLQFLRTFSKKSDIQVKKGGFRKFVVGEEENDESVGKPYGVAIHDGKIYACDTTSNYVAIFDLKNKRFDSFGRGYSGALSKPINIAVDTDGTCYVADTGHKRIMVYDSDGKYLRSLGDPEKMGPTDVELLEDQLYVCDIDNAQVVILDKETGDEIRRFGSKGSGEGQLFFPTNIAIDLDGNVFVSDTGNTRVMRFDRRDNFVMQIGALGREMGNFVRPKGIAVDREGRLYVADAAFENVQIFDDEGKLLLFFGTPGNHTGGLNLPASVVIDYDNVDYFKDLVAPGHEIEYLVLVCSQFGLNKINVYGFLKTDE